MATYTGPFVAVIHMEKLAVERHIHADVEICPVPAITHVIFGEAMSLDELPLRNATREEQGIMTGVIGV